MPEDILSPLRADPALIDALRLDMKFLLRRMATVAPETTMADPGHTDLLPAMLAHVAALAVLMSKSASLLGMDPGAVDEDRAVLAFKNMMQGVVSLASEEPPEAAAREQAVIERHIRAGTRPETLHDFVMNNHKEG